MSTKSLLVVLMSGIRSLNDFQLVADHMQDGLEICEAGIASVAPFGDCSVLQTSAYSSFFLRRPLVIEQLEKLFDERVSVRRYR